ncbi:regulator of sigma E protease [Tepidibacillus fermentans]|uniref:Zinc metalloprotease n=1 Tax=Tepidibacillus fermentans TaxID=1281767 RepID=A0A4R3KHM7_9BACI|nr:regulator of sigma E protease [Tepidibacillus fermentans]
MLEIILVFVSIMFIHELGHFIFAKRAGIFVREFSLGLGPKLFSIKKGETQYSLRILPFGAYVRMAGEDPEVIEIKSGDEIGVNLNKNDQVTDIFTSDIKLGQKVIHVEEIDLERELEIKGTDENGQLIQYPVSRQAILHYEKQKVQIAPWDRQFSSKSIFDRFATVFAGPLFNILLTIVLFFIVFNMVGVPSNKVVLGEITSNSPAEKAGLQEGDWIRSINGKTVESTQDFIGLIQQSPNQPLNITIDRQGEEKTLIVIPQFDEKTKTGRIGAVVTQAQKKATIIEAASYSVKNTVAMTKVILDGFKMILTGHVGMNDLAGPVGIMKITSDAAKQGLATLFNWASILSLYLGIFNLLPIPALDGSRLLFLTIEGLRGKPIDPKKESLVHLIGFAFMMLLMIIVTVNDVSRIFD